MTRRRTPSAPADPFADYLRRHGTCAICRERDMEHDRHGGKHCRGDWRRQHPTCTWDGRKPKFAPDLVRISQIDKGLTS